MTSSDARVRRVSGRQLEILWEFLNIHREIAVAFNRSLQAKEHAKQKWQEFADILNSQGEGAHKDWKGWSKYWVDYKAKLKKRVATVRSSQRRTGGGPSSEPPLTELEQKFLLILGEDYGQGLPGVRVEPFQEPSGSHAAAVVVDPPSPEPDPLIVIPPDAAFVPSPHHTPTQSPRRSPAAAEVAAVVPSPRSSPQRRRRRRREPPMSQEAARRALVQSSSERADAAKKSAQALEVIGQGILETNLTLQRIERTINAVAARLAE